MDKSFETSFMPQQPLLRVEGVSRRREPVNIAMILALVIFFVTLAVCGGMYFYKLQVDKRVHARAVELEEAEKLLDIDEIELYKKIDMRIDTAKNLLENHTVFTVILNLLEESSAQNIGLTSLGYSGDKKSFSLMVGGQAASYGAVYFQANAWRAMAPLVQSVSIESLNLDDTSGVVSFNARFIINPDMTKYTRLLESERIQREREAAEQVENTLVSDAPIPTKPSGPAVLVPPGQKPTP